MFNNTNIITTNSYHSNHAIANNDQSNTATNLKNAYYHAVDVLILNRIHTIYNNTRFNIIKRNKLHNSYDTTYCSNTIEHTHDITNTIMNNINKNHEHNVIDNSYNTMHNMHNHNTESNYYTKQTYDTNNYYSFYNDGFKFRRTTPKLVQHYNNIMS